MKTIGVTEAKSNFSKLLKQTEKGEAITIAKRGVPIAILIPAGTSEPKRRNVKALVEQMRRLREECPLDGVTIRELIEGGRRF